MKYPVEILTREEARAILLAPSPLAATGVRNRALIAIMYGAGLRVSEALALKVSDVDTDAASVRVLHGKGDADRTVGIDLGALVHVVRWIEVRRARGLRSRHLFCTLAGGQVSTSYVRAMMKRVAARAGVDKRVHAHGLRHTAAVEWAQEGVPVMEIRDQLGHKHLDTTATYLNHVNPAARIERIRNRRTEI